MVTLNLTLDVSKIKSNESFNDWKKNKNLEVGLGSKENNKTTKFGDSVFLSLHMYVYVQVRYNV